MKFTLEICVDNVESAIEAQMAGADRIELCNNLIEGGTTPGYGTIVNARKNLKIGLNVIIRPRGGDFLYSSTDYDIMRKDIEICGECGANGVVFGLLLANGSIDIDRTTRLIELAKPMSVTFHRAFDMCNDPYKGLDDVIATGADRLLTAGQKNKASEGLELIYNLVNRAANRIIIMPGSGINAANISQIARGTGASEFHLTGRKTVDSEMNFRAQNISMSTDSNISEFSRKVVDPDMIRSIVRTLKLI
jgi:copper homeostasis protein